MDSSELGIVLASLSLAISGLALLTGSRARLAGALLTLAGVAGTAGGGLVAAGQPATGWPTTVAGLGLLLPLALAVYPTPRWWHPLDFVALVVLGGCGLVGVVWSSERVIEVMGLAQASAFMVHTWWRIETSRGDERRSLVWMALAVSTTVVVYFLVLFSFETVNDSPIPGFAVVLFGLIGPVVYVGATLPELVDVRGLVVRSVVFGVAFLTTMCLFALILVLIDPDDGRRLSAGVLGIVAAVAATVFHPVQVALRGVVDQLLFGDRPDPLHAASAVAGTIGDDPVSALRAIREALVLPYAALLVDGALVAASGTETTHTRALDLDGAGELVVGLRPGDLSFSAGDEQVLRLTVPLLAQTLRARALAEDLIESRGQTIAAVEEERRRLRRELHDGLGPRLSGVAFTSDAARNLIRTDPAAAEAAVAQLRADTVIAIEEIRRMVYAMRPPALDELGLVPALQQQAAGLRNRDGASVSVEVTAPEAFPDLPAAVEVAAYRIVTEALTNVARHSSSATATVCLRPAADGLHLEVTDLGGRDGPWRPGVGLASMRERAAELGGTLEAGPGPGGGRVAALLPL